MTRRLAPHALVVITLQTCYKKNIASQSARCYDVASHLANLLQKDRISPMPAHRIHPCDHLYAPQTNMVKV